MNEVTVCLPTRDEEKNIAKVIQGIQAVSPDYDILVVDDSDDNRTRIIAVMLGAKVIEGQHKGLGQAIIDGIKACDSEIIIVCDADSSHPVKKIPELISACKDGYEMSIGSRYIDGGSIYGWTLKRKIISKIASFIAYPLTGKFDNSSGMFCFKSSLLDRVHLEPTSWKIMLELLVKSKAKAIEIPIEFRDRQAGESKFNKKEVFNYLKHLVKLTLWKYRLANFMMVGGLGYLINMAIYYPLTLWFKDTVTFLGQEFYLPPFLISSFVAITSNYFLNKLSTFKDRKEKSLGYLKYLTTCSASLPIEMLLIFLWVHFLDITPILAVAIAILTVFIARYLIVSRVVWNRS